MEAINIELAILANKLQKENEQLREKCKQLELENQNLKKNNPKIEKNNTNGKYPVENKKIEKIEKIVDPTEACDKFEYAKINLPKYMEKYGLFSNGWKWGFNNRSTSAGITHWGKENKITLSNRFISSEKTTIQDIQNTILHEIAHALVGPHNKHNDIWKTKALEIGCNGKVCCNNFNENYNYTIKCTKGCEIRRMKIMKSYQNGEKNFICAKHKEIMEIKSLAGIP